MLGLFKKKKASDARSELESFLGGYSLPHFPTVTMQALELTQDTDSSTHEINELLATDPGLTVRVLGLANSPAFSPRHPVKSLPHAITLLGRQQLESLLISLAVHVAVPSEDVAGFNRSRFWNTAARRSVAARHFATEIDPSTESQSATAALLQDMAIPLLAHHRAKEYGPVLEQWHATDIDLLELERQELSWNHAEVATWMAQSWNLPEHLITAIAAHHGSPTTESCGMPAVALVGAMREENEDFGIQRVVDQAQSYFDLDEAWVHDLLSSSSEEAVELAQLFH